MEELERYKDKVELSLDGRQIFFLFFGSAVAACLIFVAGVLVGRRIEQHALASAAPVAEDPLAVLDQIDSADSVSDGLTFPEALVRDEKRRPREDPSRAAAPEPAAEAAPKPEGHVDPERPAARPDPAPKRPDLPTLPALKKPDPVGAKKPEPPAPKKPDGAPTGRFTLQLSSFADKSDAESFAQKMRTAGYRPQVIKSDVPGKGTFFRVRVGDFSSRQAAAQAQAEYERKQHGVAYVAPL